MNERVSPDWPGYIAGAVAEFLAEHDNEVSAKTLEWAADHYKSGVFVGRDDYARAWLRSRAWPCPTAQAIGGESRASRE